MATRGVDDAGMDFTPENAGDMARRATKARVENRRKRAAGAIPHLRDRLVARLASVVDGEDIDTVIKAAPTIRMLTDDTDASTLGPDPLAERYRALGYEPPF